MQTFSRSHTLTTPLFFLFSILVFAQAMFAEASDIEALTFFPSEGASFYTTDTITFSGQVHNTVNEVLPEVGYADIEIDWGSNNGPPQTNTNANPDNSENMLGSLTSYQSKNLQEIVANPTAGTHRYRFVVDTTDVVTPETDDANNTSPWVSFTVVPFPVPPDITFAASANPIMLGNSTNLEWTVVGATSCTGSNGSAGWSGAKNKDGGSESVSPSVTTLYTLTCTGTGGTATKSFTVDVVTPVPSITLTASANPINLGDAVSLTWSTTNADSCTASGGWSDAKGLTGTESVSPVTTTTYTLDCTGPGGNTSKSNAITVNGSLPIITLTASPSSVPSGSGSTISWDVVGATSCYGQNVGGWNGVKDPTSGSYNTGNLTVATIYRLSCGNEGAGTTSEQVTVSVTGLPDLYRSPWSNGYTSKILHTSVASTSANSLTESIANTFRGQVTNIGVAATLTGFKDTFYYRWGWTGASQEIGSVNSSPLNVGEISLPYEESPIFTPDRSGLLEVRYAHDTDNEVAETNESNNNAWIVYTVQGAPGSPIVTPTVTDSYRDLPAYPYSMSRALIGSTSTISWTATDATDCTAEKTQNAGNENWTGSIDPVSGSIDVSPVATTSYSITCTGPNGTQVIPIRIHVQIDTPTVTLSATPASIPRGSITTLNWTAESAKTCTGSSNPTDPLWDGHKNRNGGSLGVSPLVDTTYTLLCDSTTGAYGSSVARQITISVSEPQSAISLTASPNPITPIDSTNLTWIVADAVSCVGTSNPSDSVWNGAKDIIGGTLTVAPDVTTTYTVTCTNDGVSYTNAPVTVSVASTPARLDTFMVTNNVIVEDNSSTLTWLAVGADNCEASSVPPDASWDDPSLPLSGSQDLTPSVTTEYSIACTGQWGDSSQYKTEIKVVPKSDITLFKVCVKDALDINDPAKNCAEVGETLTVNPGTPLEVGWDSLNAGNCDAVSGYDFSTGGATDGVVDAQATPYADSNSSYTLVCSTLWLPTSPYETILVHTNAVLPEIWITPKVVESSGGNITVGWNTNNGDQTVCSLRGGGLSNADLLAAYVSAPSTGQAVDVPVFGRTSFVITCPTLDGTASTSATTTVELSPRIWGR